MNTIKKGEKTKKKKKIEKSSCNSNKCLVGLAKVLDFFLWYLILVLVLGILGYVGEELLPLSLDSFRVRELEGFPPTFLALMGCLLQQDPEVISPDDYIVSSILFLLSTVQVVVGACGSSLPVCERWSDLLLFSPGGSWIALQLQLWLVSSSPSKVGQFSFVHTP
jgi:hypothetical protein